METDVIALRNRIRESREVPRPKITLPPFTLSNVGSLDPADVRWPLVRAPKIEPHAELVSMFRGTGSWEELCAARGDPRRVDRDEALAYLSAWCAYKGDARTRQKLVPLAAAKSARIANAAHADIVDLLAVDPFPASAALTWLQTHNLDQIEILDALAATYQALDKTSDAAVVVTSLRGRHPPGLAADRCRRLLRDFLVTHRDVRPELYELDDAPSCAAIVHAIRRAAVGSTCPLITKRWPQRRCTRPMCEDIINELVINCSELLPPDKAGSDTVDLIMAYENWPVGERRAAIWIEYARFVNGFPFPDDARALLVAALENAALRANCQTDVPAIVELARAAKAPRSRALAYLRELTPEKCSTRHSPTLDHHPLPDTARAKQ